MSDLYHHALAWALLPIIAGRVAGAFVLDLIFPGYLAGRIARENQLARRIDDGTQSPLWPMKRGK